MRMKICLLLAIMLSCSECIFSQINVHSVSLDGAYFGGLTKKGQLKIEKADGFGGELNIKFNLYKNLKLSVSGGYQAFSIDQEIHSLFKEWDWRGWKRYFGDINDTNITNFTNKYVQILLKDSAIYKGTFTAVQSMDLFPVVLTLSYDIPVTNNLTVCPFLGGGVLFYTRRLYEEESWQKKFPELNYQFDYSYRNWGPNKYGNPFAAVAGFTAEYAVADYVKLGVGAKYFYVLQTTGKYGYEKFPVKDLFSAKLGFTFVY